MSDHRQGGGGSQACALAGRWSLAAALLAAMAGCTASPEYPISAGDRPGDGTITANPPRYPISAADAAQNARDQAARNGYPDYGAAPMAEPQGSAYGAPPAAPPPPASDDPADEASHPLPQSSVESSDLPPPSAAPPAGEAPPPPPPDGAVQPHAISWGGGQIVWGAEPVGAPTLELAAYRRHRRKAAAAAEDGSDAAPAAVAPKEPGTDTPYQTAVRPGEKLADIAERTHSSKDALVQLNGLKHPRHVKAGTVLKIPYRYSYEVQKGDTLYTISHRFNQDPAAIAKLNGLKTAPTLQPGQSLDLPTDASDNGKRDHAAAAEPTPVAAPDKLADAALRKAERHGRRHPREAESAAAPAPADTAVAAAAPPAHETRRERRRREREEAAASRQAAATPADTAVASATPPPHETRRERRRREQAEAATARLAAATPRPAPPPAAATPSSEVAADAAPLKPSPEPVRAAPAPLRPSPEPVPAASGAAAPLRPSPEPVRPAATVATAPEAPRTPSFVPPAAASRATVSAAAGAPTNQPYYAGVRPTPAPSQPYSPGVRPSPEPGYAPSRVASLTPPRYTPGSPSGAYEPSLGRERPTAPVASAGPVSSSEVATAGRGRFIWPLRGQIVSSFGIKGEGQHNDGMDIAAIPGTGVRAAAAGEVVYAGSSIPGFGNLVLVKHPGGWVTAYAHLDRIEVRMRDTVAQGQEIGQAGQTGAVERPLLHFEVRYAPSPTEKARPVDPTLVLPAG